MRKRVYIAGPISKGDLADNIRQANAAFDLLAALGYAPWCPQWSCYSHDPMPVPDCPGRVVAIGSAAGGLKLRHSDWLAVDLAWVAVADAVLRLPGESLGADMETAEARRLGITVFHSIKELQAGLPITDAA